MSMVHLPYGIQVHLLDLVTDCSSSVAIHNNKSIDQRLMKGEHVRITTVIWVVNSS